MKIGEIIRIMVIATIATLLLSGWTHQSLLHALYAFCYWSAGTFFVILFSKWAAAKGNKLTWMEICYVFILWPMVWLYFGFRKWCGGSIYG